MVKFVYLCVNVVICIFYFSDPRSLKIENENYNMKILPAEAPYIGLEFSL